jgi:hypothetical protein
MQHLLIKSEWRVKYKYKDEWYFSDRTRRTRASARKMREYYKNWTQESKVVRVMAQEF